MSKISFSLKFNEIKTRLTKIGKNDPISKLSLVTLIFLDIFILITIFIGLEDHTKQIATIDDYITYKCQNFILDADKKTDIEKMDLIKNEIIKEGFTEMSFEYIKEKENYLHPICKELDIKLKTISGSTSLYSLFQTLRDNEIIRNKIQYELDAIKQNYDTFILEKIATKDTNIDELKKGRDNKIEQLNKIEKLIKDINGKITQDKDYLLLWDYILGNNSEKIITLQTDLNIALFMFPIRKLLMEFLFLIPLFLIFLVWNSRSINNNHGLQGLISSHLLVIVFIPIFWKIIEAIFEIIPKRLIREIMEFLVSFKLLAIWYYVIVFLGILIGLFTIYLIQKKIFSKEKLEERRLSKGECYGCGKKIPGSTEYCPFCGLEQYRTCSICKKRTHTISKYCINCGK